MSSADSRMEYERRMHRVLEHIDRNLDQSLDLAALAEVACFSPFHFHRLSSAWLGETLGDYLRRRRLEVAAMRLAAQPGVPVLQVALSVGFGSAEAFARAFKGRFGSSPTAWRSRQAEARAANSKFDQADRKQDQVARSIPADHGPSIYRNMEASMDVKNLDVRILDRLPVPVAYLRYKGPYGPSVSQFWQQTVYPWMVANGVLGQPRYGISHDDPGITAPVQCRYDAAVEVPPSFVLSGKAMTTTIPGGKYAVLAFKGRVDEIQGAWTALLRDWLPASGFQLDARPCFEHYPMDAGYDPKTGVFECGLCIPVAPL